MTKAGFKTNRFDSLKRQMNAYGFKFIHACDEHDGAWYHPSSNFGLTGERDHAIIPLLYIIMFLFGLFVY